MTISLVAVVSHWSDLIKDGRTLRSVSESIHEEAGEIVEEIDLLEAGAPAGKDGVFGEAVDVIAGALDMIRLVRPDATIADLEAEVAEYLNRKCHKWASKYGGYEGAYVPLKEA